MSYLKIRSCAKCVAPQTLAHVQNVPGCQNWSPVVYTDPAEQSVQFLHALNFQEELFTEGGDQNT